jgi:hypothetical protein
MLRPLALSASGWYPAWNLKSLAKGKRSERTRTMIRVRVQEDRALVHEQPSAISPVISELRDGDEFSIGKTVKTSTESWCEATLPGGRTGYVPATIKIFRIRPVMLNQPNVSVLSYPAAGSPEVVSYQRGDRFTVAGVKRQGEEAWVEIRTLGGATGFIPPGTRIAEDGGIRTGGSGSASSKELAKRNLVRGFFWLAGGLAVTAVTYSMASSSPEGGHYVIAWGAMIFGGIQFLRGLYGYLASLGE